MTTKQPGYYRDLLESISRRAFSPRSTGVGVGFPITRDDGEEIDVWVSFDATQTARAFAGSRNEPPHGAEYEYEITSIKEDAPGGLRDPEPPFSESEKERIIAHFNEHEQDAAYDAVSDEEAKHSTEDDYADWRREDRLERERMDRDWPRDDD